MQMDRTKKFKLKKEGSAEKSAFETTRKLHRFHTTVS
jgi:hypothetical protein